MKILKLKEKNMKSKKVNLYEKLQKITTEEEVKKIYIDTLKLINVKLGVDAVDMKTDKIWFEAKKDNKTSTAAMFTQLLFYVKKAKNEGLELPEYLSVIDTEKAAIMETKNAIELLEDDKIDWGKNASSSPQNIDTVNKVSENITVHAVSFHLKTHEHEFLEVMDHLKMFSGIYRKSIVDNNIERVFKEWKKSIGDYLDLSAVSGKKSQNLILLFLADTINDGVKAAHENLPAILLFKNGNPVFFLENKLENKLIELSNYDGYKEFWSIYQRPPKDEVIKYLITRTDKLLPKEDREFEGAFYTPANLVEKAYDFLAKNLGNNWQKEYYVWDMCAGTANLEFPHSIYKRVFISTLNNYDLDLTKTSRTCVGAIKFQYDYLNDDIDDDGNIDYTLTKKVPLELQELIKEVKNGSKKLLVLMNPPYGEAGSGINEGNRKKSVSMTKIKSTMAPKNLKLTSSELFVQFLIRIQKELPTAKLAMFSKLKYLNAPNSVKFRDYFNAEFINGFMVHSKIFEGLKGDFPIGFLLWQINNFKTEFPKNIKLEVLNEELKFTACKEFTAYERKDFLNSWFKRPPANKETVVPLKNATTVAICNMRVTKWSDGAIAYLLCHSNDMQQVSQQTALFSSVFAGGNGFYVNKENLKQGAVIFAVRRLIKHTWINDRDQFVIPHSEPSEEFYNDCLIYMLFNGSNLTAEVDNLEWEGRTWSITNHFIPFTEKEIYAAEAFKSDFMHNYLTALKESTGLSKESLEVLETGKAMWKNYFENGGKIPSWYYARKTSNKNSLLKQSFLNKYEILSQKLIPDVYNYGFLKS